MLAKLMSSHWWVLLLRGVFAILFGIVAYGWPGMTLATLLTFFGAFVFVDGVFNVFHAVSDRKEHEHWWVLLLEGLLGIAFGVITFQAPEITATVMILYIAFWAMASGILRIILAVRLRKEIEGEWWMVLSGLVSVVFGVLMMARPGAGALAVLWVVAIWSIVGGVFLVILSFKVKGLGGRLEDLKQKLAAQRGGKRGMTRRPYGELSGRHPVAALWRTRVPCASDGPFAASSPGGPGPRPRSICHDRVRIAEGEVLARRRRNLDAMRIMAFGQPPR